MGMEIEGDGRARISSTRSGCRSRLASYTNWQSRQPERDTLEDDMGMEIEDIRKRHAYVLPYSSRNNDDSASASPSDNSSSVNRRWDSVIQEVLRNAVKKFNDFMNSYRNQSKGVVKSVDAFERGSEVVDNEDWDWDRWRKHFSEVDEQERIVSILKVIQRLERIISQFGFYSRTRYSLQVHPTVKAFKHAYAVRLNLGDPDFVNVSSAVSNMLSPKFAASFTAATIVNAQEEGPCHALHSVDGRTICQLVAQKLEGPNSGMLVAANDPRKGGFPADMKDDLLCYRSMVPLFWCRIDNLLQALRYVAQFGSLRYRRCSRKSGVHHALNPDPYSGVFGSDREKYARDVEDLITFGTSGRVAERDSWEANMGMEIEGDGGACISST
ncbi:hypothetical protein HYC85_009327 [Camellia sinensis]|uniref:Uncharacterized protein n=1 Tax=Camellia sinensis TaxID=4442 RepID=A0A7J7HEN5_CAMSI|nr:hypothetical protein HYC85_009327 [Camellia sinensis]